MPGKLFKVKGGLIHQISNKDLLAQRNSSLYSDDEKNFIKLLTIDNEALVQPLGSVTFKIQKYPSDIDINQVIKIKNNNFNEIVNHLRRVVINILKTPNVFFSDFKAGVDGDNNAIRWLPNDILNGYKVLNDGSTIPLELALQMESIIKLDVIGYSNDRFIEASTFIILEKVNNRGQTEYINVPSDFFEQYLNNVKADIIKFSTTGNNFKLFKAVKRMWSLSRITKDFYMLRRLEPLINSDLSLISQINADIESMGLIIEKYDDDSIPYDLFIHALSVIGKKISTIVDIPLDINEIIIIINSIITSINRRDRNEILRTMEDFHEYLLNILNVQSYEYLTSNNLYPFDLK